LYSVSEVKNPFGIDNDYIRENKVPLEDDKVVLLHENLDWSEFLWGTDFVEIKGK